LALISSEELGKSSNREYRILLVGRHIAERQSLRDLLERMTRVLVFLALKL
jgi:hypothetical protein